MSDRNKKLADQAVQIAKSTLGQVLIHPGGPYSVAPRNILETGKQVRENQLHKFPILPGAISVFIQLASSREWAVSGRPRGVSRAVEWINNASTRDPYTGQTYSGFQQFLQRRAMDYLTIGRTTYAVRRTSGSPLEYVDPAYLRFNRKARRLDGLVSPVKPHEKVWSYYDGEQYRSDEVFLDHPLPLGSHLFISPITYILPTAHLAWLLREHQSAHLDGRKIRDVIIVGNPQLADGIEKAVHQMAALWSGETVDRVGVPVVEAQNSSGTPMENYITRLGLSEIPDNFNEEAFIDSYVNQIAAGLGLTLRHFWNNEKTTNRALEEVQEQRQQQKGPSYFIRTEQRLLNNSGVLEQFGKGVNKVRFGFIEETDLSRKLNDAQVLLQSAEALSHIRDVFGDTITAESYLAWMQNLGTLPYEVELSGDTLPTTTVEGSDTNSVMNKEEEGTQSGDEAPTAFSKNLKYDEIRMNQDGQILEKRLKIFSVLKLLTDELYQEKLREVKPMSDDEAFDLAVAASNEKYKKIVSEAYESNKEVVDSWIRTQVLFDSVIAQSALDKCVKQEALTPGEQEIIDSLVVNLDLD